MVRRFGNDSFAVRARRDQRSAGSPQHLGVVRVLEGCRQAAARQKGRGVMSWAKHHRNTEILKEAAGGELNSVLTPRGRDLFLRIL